MPASIAGCIVAKCFRLLRRNEGVKPKICPKGWRISGRLRITVVSGESLIAREAVGFAYRSAILQTVGHTMQLNSSPKRRAQWTLRKPSLIYTLFVAQLLMATIAIPESVAAPKQAAVVMDANTGKILYSSNADAHRYPASLTKMMTLYIVFEMLESGRLSPDSKLLMTKNAARQPPSKLGLKPGDTITVRNAIRALVTKSANDIAVAVAENIAGTEAKFARYMTWKAKQLGMKQTTFHNASGLPNRKQLTTARDMLTLGLRLQDHFPKSYRHFKTKSFQYRKRRYRNHNRLLFNFSGTDGIKTGYTRASGFNLVASVRRGRKHVIGVVMGGRTASKRNARMRTLLSRGLKRASTKRTRKKSPLEIIVVARAAPSKTASGRSGLTKSSVTTPNSVSKNASQTTSVTRGYAVTSTPGPFHVQVGAYGTPTEAQSRLAMVSKRARVLLRGHKPVTVAYQASKQKWYRARFSGFTKLAARKTCQGLKRKKIDCVVMSAN